MTKTTLTIFLALGISFAASAKVLICPAPEKEAKFGNCTLKVDGKNVDVYECTVSKYPINQVWPGYQRPIEQTEKAGFAYWDMGEDGATIEITTTKTNCRNVVVRPLSLGIKPQFKKNKITFKLNKIKPIVVEINGYHHALHLFPNPIQDDSALKKTTLCAPQCSYCSTYLNEIPKDRDPHYYYFAPGRHDVGTLRLKSNDRVHIAAGAVVYGSFVADDAENIKITGRGILDGSKIERADKWARGGFGCLHFRNCKNVSVDGIILRDPNSWTVNVRRCENVDISNLKFVGLWRYNSDGIDIWDSKNVTFKDCFIRAYDDSIIVRATGPDNKNIFVENCVIWNDWGKSLAISLHGKPQGAENISFKNIDIIRPSSDAIHFANYDTAACMKNVRCENINIEVDDIMPRQLLQKKRGEVYKFKPNDNYVPRIIYVYLNSPKGVIDNISFENIKITGNENAESRFKGHNAEHPISNISVKNISINGKVAENLKDANIRVGKFVEKIKIEK